MVKSLNIKVKRLNKENTYQHTHQYTDQSPCIIMRGWHTLFLSNDPGKMAMFKSLSQYQKVKSGKTKANVHIYVLTSK